MSTGEPRRPGRGIVVILMIAILAVVVWISTHQTTTATVTYWRVGDSYITGTAHNGDAGCSDFRVNLSFRDHNGALLVGSDVGTYNSTEIRLGDAPSGADKSWSTQITARLGANVRSVEAVAHCYDRH